MLCSVNRGAEQGWISEDLLNQINGAEVGALPAERLDRRITGKFQLYTSALLWIESQLRSRGRSTSSRGKDRNPKGGDDISVTTWRDRQARAHTLRSGRLTPRTTRILAIAAS
jgi:hypothetical protein